MGSKNIFVNENIKLRLINIEYSYKQKFASSDPKIIQDAKDDLKQIFGEFIKKKLIRILHKILKFIHLKSLYIRMKNQVMMVLLFISQIKRMKSISCILFLKEVQIIKTGLIIFLVCFLGWTIVNIMQLRSLLGKQRRKQEMTKI